MAEVVSHTERDRDPATVSFVEIQQEAPPQAMVKPKRGASVKHRATRPEGYKRLYSITEAGHYLGRSSWSVRRLVWAGALPQVRAGGRVHLDIRDLDEFIEQNKVREESG
ncbi:MAG: helix-turn-helix domain-containing protein [Nitrospira sp.]|nr:MAG: helix-turn-helix domain-containing protein [Nitrospira sp.]